MIQILMVVLMFTLIIFLVGFVTMSLFCNPCEAQSIVSSGIVGSGLALGLPAG